MDYDGFRIWVEAEGKAPGTVTQQLSRARTIESAFGDLDQAHRRDRLVSILAGLRYSREDEARRVPLPGGLETSGDPVQMYERLRVTGRKIVRFLDERAARLAAPGSTPVDSERRPSRLRILPIRDDRGRILDARVEMGDNHIVLHSRSGPETGGRNPHYRHALVTILSRLAREGIAPEVFLDSVPAQRERPLLDDRRLASQSELLIDPSEAANLLIRRSNAGSRSHGAWRRLLLRTPIMPDFALASILDGTVAARPTPLPTATLREVKRHHIDVAIGELARGEERHTRFNVATAYALIDGDGTPLLTREGAPLPPKQVFGIALSEALQTYIGPNDFSSGRVIFGIMGDRGLRVVPLSEFEAIRTDGGGRGLRSGPGESQPPDDETRWLEGHPKVRSHVTRERSDPARKAFKARFLAMHKRYFCQRCDQDYVEAYGEFAEGCFEVHHHSVQVSDMTPGHQTSLDDLRLLCANCHRATHREMARL
jgi:hypothetical protein